jgi:allophanate hydrolase
LAVVGAHLRGMPLCHQLTDRGARFVEETRTAARYRLQLIPGTQPQKPGLSRVEDGTGTSIELEVWEYPVAAVGEFLNLIPSPLGLGTIELQDGSWVKGFICEPWGLVDAEDISHHGGFRAWMSSRIKT